MTTAATINFQKLSFLRLSYNVPALVQCGPNSSSGATVTQFQRRWRRMQISDSTQVTELNVLHWESQFGSTGQKQLRNLPTRLLNRV